MTAAKVTIDAGRIEGRTAADGKVRSFLGIPYAAPPVGDLRWRPPHPVMKWRGTRQALRYGPSSLQPRVAANSLYCGGERDVSEDCLYLNVWTGAAGESARPVLVWFHFGGFQFGSASNPIYDGAVLAREGATVVSVNYRLGRLGFLAHPALSAESDWGVSGNYGMLDQLAALRWVQENIEAFGGDPAKVTVLGLSAGGHSVHNLRASDLAEGLFQRAVAHSGPGVAPVIDGPGHPAGPHSLAAAEQAGEEVADQLDARTATQLRAIPAETLAAVRLPRVAGPWMSDMLPGSPTSMHAFDSAYPVVDGYVLRESPLTAYQTGRTLDVPMIVGNVGNEGSGLSYLRTLDEYHHYVNDEYGDHAQLLLDLYPTESDADVPASSRALEGDRVFTWSGWTAARLQANAGKAPVWFYNFLRQPPVVGDVAERHYAGAYHGAELPYLFGTYAVWDWPWTDADHALGRQLRSTWLRFAETGDPSGVAGDGSAIPVWDPFSVHAPSALAWDVPTPTMVEVPHRERLAAFDTIHGLTDDLP